MDAWKERGEGKQEEHEQVDGIEFLKGTSGVSSPL